MIKNIIQPESELEFIIISNPEFIKGANWGKPRDGHPEGKVILHIRDVLLNVDKFSNQHNRSDLRIIAMVHDTFKYKVDLTKPKKGSNHHAYLARKFTEQYIDDQSALQIIELHDEAFNSWYKGFRTNNWQAAEERAKKLIDNLDDLELYLTFYKCDNQVEGKQRENYNWFVELVKQNSK